MNEVIKKLSNILSPYYLRLDNHWEDERLTIGEAKSIDTHMKKTGSPIQDAPQYHINIFINQLNHGRELELKEAYVLLYFMQMANKAGIAEEYFCEIKF